MQGIHTQVLKSPKNITQSQLQHCWKSFTQQMLEILVLVMMMIIVMTITKVCRENSPFHLCCPFQFLMLLLPKFQTWETTVINSLCIFPAFLYVFTSKHKCAFFFLSPLNKNLAYHTKDSINYMYHSTPFSTFQLIWRAFYINIQRTYSL